ncbi:hypothetical protein COU74_00570 [Candidatus Peregrinibacteria bacterium CG10_big_fil_rev_8_21_14_0_10_36_19]|nr:MAG: hypothetical protein COU74_00570 [Candidatus Peregrinibacteria bacterium CG10_big_fil_rev_8_21_14_0_10_36_19]
MLNKYKEYWLFFVCILLFFVLIGYVLYIYFTWNANGNGDDPIEVSLPVIEWQKYTNLSKTQEVSKIK